MNHSPKDWVSKAMCHKGLGRAVPQESLVAWVAQRVVALQPAVAVAVGASKALNGPEAPRG